MTENGAQKEDSKVEVKTADEILEAAETEADHKGNSTQLLTVNNELVRTQIHQQQRLENEIEDLRGSLDSFKYWSRGLTIALIILSIVTAILTLGLLLSELGIIA